MHAAFAGGVALTSILDTAVSLRAVARNIHLREHRLSLYSPISNTLVRFFIVVACISSVLPLASIFLTGTVDDFVLLLTFTILLLISFPAILFVIPVVVIRNRVARLLQQSLLTVMTELDTDPSNRALQDRLMFLESRPIWPIGDNTRRIVLFGLIPPFTWMLAAAIENAIY